MVVGFGGVIAVAVVIVVLVERQLTNRLLAGERGSRKAGRDVAVVIVGVIFTRGVAFAVGGIDAGIGGVLVSESRETLFPSGFRPKGQM